MSLEIAREIVENPLNQLGHAHNEAVAAAQALLEKAISAGPDERARIVNVFNRITQLANSEVTPLAPVKSLPELRPDQRFLSRELVDLNDSCGAPRQYRICKGPDSGKGRTLIVWIDDELDLIKGEQQSRKKVTLLERAVLGPCDRHNSKIGLINEFEYMQAMGQPLDCIFTPEKAQYAQRESDLRSKETSPAILERNLGLTNWERIVWITDLLETEAEVEAIWRWKLARPPGKDLLIVQSDYDYARLRHIMAELFQSFFKVSEKQAYELCNKAGQGAWENDGLILRSLAYDMPIKEAICKFSGLTEK